MAAAFKSIGAAAREAEQAQTRGAAGAEQAVTRGAARGAAATARGEAQRRKSAEQSAAVFERAFAKEAAAADKAAQAEIRAAEKAGAGVLRAREKAAAAQTRIREAQEAARKKADAAAERDHQRHEARQTAIATKEANTRARAYQHAVRAGQADNRQRMGRLGSAAKDATLGAAATVGAAGMAVVGAAARDSFRLGEVANRVSINSRQAGEEFVDSKTLQKEWSNIATATPGVKAMDIGEAVGGYVAKTGNLKQGREFARTFATTAAATGAGAQDVAAAGAALSKKFGISSESDMQAALASVTFGGKAGAFEMKDAAAKYEKLASAGAAFGLDKGVGGVKTLQGLSQIAMDSTGDRDTAVTATEAMMRQLITESGTIEKSGVKVFSDKGKTKTRNISDILAETIAASGGDKTKLQGIFGDEGKRAINPLIDTFTTAKNNATGTEAEKTAAGLAALRQQLDRSINAPGTWADVQKDAAQAGKNTSSQLTAVWETVVAKVGEQVVPGLESLAEKFMDLDGPLDALVGTAEVLVDAFGALFDLLASMPGLKQFFSSSDTKQQKKAQRELDKFDKEMAKKGLNATPEDIAKRGKLADEVERLTPGMVNASDELRVKTPEELKAEKAKLADKNAMGTAGVTAMSMLGGGIGQLLSTGHGRQNDAQNAVDKAQAENVAREKGEPVNTKETQSALNSLTSTLLKVAASISGVSAGGYIAPNQ